MSTSVGRQAETCIERWLEEEGWTCFERNMRVPGGEIDRLFVRERCVSGVRVDLCVAEVKATRLKKGQGLSDLFSAAKIRSLIRPQQLRILWRSAASYEHRLESLTKAPVRTYVRYFLVVYATRAVLRETRSEFRRSRTDLPVRLCRTSDENLIFSWSPDVVGLGL